MAKFTVTAAVTNLCQKLIEEGYTGTIQLTNNYPTGAKSILGSDFSMALSGFCKETLYVTVDVKDGEIGLIGRYHAITWQANPSVEALADVAWQTYQMYKSKGYSRPTEWEKIWVKYGHLIPKTTVVLEEKE